MSTTKVGTRLLGTGSVIQTATFQSGALFSTSGLIPPDDTIPQITEGGEWTNIVFTPKSSTSSLHLHANLYMGYDGTSVFVSAAIFRDAVADALAAMTMYTVAGSGASRGLSLVHTMTSGTTAAITFRVRVGASSGNAYINGAITRTFGGVGASSFVITEIAA